MNMYEPCMGHTTNFPTPHLLEGDRRPLRAQPLQRDADAQVVNGVRAHEVHQPRLLQAGHGWRVWLLGCLGGVCAGPSSKFNPRAGLAV